MKATAREYFRSFPLAQERTHKAPAEREALAQETLGELRLRIDHH